MAENTYEYECMRAELLGLERPNKESFEATRKERLEAESEDLEAQQFQELDTQDDQFKNTSGKLDELNSILSVTQQKINKFKHACGSLSNLLKVKIGKHEKINDDGTSEDTCESPSTSKKHEQLTINDALDTLEQIQDNEKRSLLSSTSSANNTPIINRKKQSTLDSKFTSHLDKLDVMLVKADNAQYAMSEQNKEMKKFLK